jgi:hypothetical protein
MIHELSDIDGEMNVANFLFKELLSSLNPALHEIRLLICLQNLFVDACKVKW